MTRTRAISILASVLFPLAAASTASATSACDAVPDNLLVNCGFESGSFSGWSVTATNFTAVDNSNPSSGTFGASLGSTSAAFLSQTVTDVAGAYYSLSFNLDNEYAVTANGTLYPGGNLFNVYYENASGSYFNLASNTNMAETGTYINYKYYFYGSGTDTIIFLFQNVPSYFELDDVVFKDPPAPGSDVATDSTDIAPTPEPSSLLLMGTGVLALAGFTRRRLKKDSMEPTA